ncbi:MAG: hypothetical protein J5496_09650 [Lachnospiraceae bacterium]|nr:hypothetical protein [Lachnospiraceae bacterium]
MKTKTRRILALICVLMLLAAGLYALVWAKINLPPTYDGSKVNMNEVVDPNVEDLNGADGAAAIIVQKNLDEAYAANDVASVVFDFRGYDTLGESFILLTAIAGSFVILAISHREAGKEEEKDEV